MWTHWLVSLVLWDKKETYTFLRSEPASAWYRRNPADRRSWDEPGGRAGPSPEMLGYDCCSAEAETWQQRLRPFFCEWHASPPQMFPFKTQRFMIIGDGIRSWTKKATFLLTFQSHHGHHTRRKVFFFYPALPLFLETQVDLQKIKFIVAFWLPFTSMIFVKVVQKEKQAYVSPSSTVSCASQQAWPESLWA